MTATALPNETVAGYRLVRRLGSGSRSDVHLATGSTGTVALKLFRPDIDAESANSEVGALGRIESPHLVRLIDVSNTDRELPVLVFERVVRQNLADLLADRGTIECGEAVTVLAPLATLVGELAGAGVSHSRIRASSVHFGTERQPVLLGFGHCHLFEAGGTMAAIDHEPAAAVDRDALALLASSVLARVRTSDAGGRVADLLRWIEEIPRAYEFPGELAERLFACAEPLPISEPAGRYGAGVDRPVPVSHGVRPPFRSAEAVAADPIPARFPGWMADLLADNPLDVLKKRAITFVRGVRPRLWVIAGASALGLILAAALIPSGGETHSSSPQHATTAKSVLPSPTRTPTPLPEDPVLAAKVLLGARATCLHDLSILCLDGVDEPSSAAFSSDAALIQQVQQGAELPAAATVPGSALALTERLGDTALIGLGIPGQSASILVIRSRAGWRIRDYLTGQQSTPGP
jgi:hypothetical protein